MNEVKEPSALDRFRRDVNLAAFLMSSAALTVTVPLRTDVGERAIGIRGLVGLVLMLLFLLGWPTHPARLHLAWCLAFLLCCGIQRWQANRRRDRCWTEHSRYEGAPLLHPLYMRLLGRRWPLGPLRFKRQVEPILIFGVGALLVPLEPPLGFWFITASVCLVVDLGMRKTIERTRRLDLNDFRAEHRDRCVDDRQF